MIEMAFFIFIYFKLHHHNSLNFKEMCFCQKSTFKTIHPIGFAFKQVFLYK